MPLASNEGEEPKMAPSGQLRRTSISSAVAWTFSDVVAHAALPGSGCALSTHDLLRQNDLLQQLLSRMNSIEAGLYRLQHTMPRVPTAEVLVSAQPEEDEGLADPATEYIECLSHLVSFNYVEFEERALYVSVQCVYFTRTTRGSLAEVKSGVAPIVKALHIDNFVRIYGGDSGLLMAKVVEYHGVVGMWPPQEFMDACSLHPGSAYDAAAVTVKRPNDLRIVSDCKEYGDEDGEAEHFACIVDMYRVRGPLKWMYGTKNVYAFFLLKYEGTGKLEWAPCKELDSICKTSAQREMYRQWKKAHRIGCGHCYWSTKGCSNCGVHPF